MLGVRPEAGRLFREDEDHEGRGAVALLGYGFWMERLGGDRSVIGQSITLDDTSYTVIGVLPRGFRFPKGGQLGSLIALPSRVDVVRPAAFTADDRDTLVGDFDWAVIGRLAPTATASQAESQLNASAGRHRPADRRTPARFSATVIPLHEQVVGQARRGLVLLGSGGRRGAAGDCRQPGEPRCSRASRLAAARRRFASRSAQSRLRVMSTGRDREPDAGRRRWRPRHRRRVDRCADAGCARAGGSAPDGGRRSGSDGCLPLAVATSLLTGVSSRCCRRGDWRGRTHRTACAPADEAHPRPGPPCQCARRWSPWRSR